MISQKNTLAVMMEVGIRFFELPLFVKNNLNITNISDYTIVNTILSKG